MLPSREAPWGRGVGTLQGTWTICLRIVVSRGTKPEITWSCLNICWTLRLTARTRQLCCTMSPPTKEMINIYFTILYTISETAEIIISNTLVKNLPATQRSNIAVFLSEQTSSKIRKHCVKFNSQVVFRKTTKKSSLIYNGRGEKRNAF